MHENASYRFYPIVSTSGNAHVVSIREQYACTAQPLATFYVRWVT